MGVFMGEEMKVLCYGVRDVEEPFFKALNKDYRFDITCIPDYLNTAETAKMAEGFQAVILRGNCWATKENLDIYKACGVQYVLTRTVGVNHIDTEYARSLGFKMAYVPFYSPNAIAELAVTHAMMLLRNMALTADSCGHKDFRVVSAMFSREIRNCVVGIIGLGRIGFTAAKLFKGLGAQVLGYDIYKKENVEDIVRQVELDELIQNSDIISVHVPFIKGNEKLGTEAFFNKMKKNAIFINTGRGETVDTRALINVVKSGHLAGAGVDTLDKESELFFKDFSDKEIENADFRELAALYPRVLISPHIGSFTDEAVKNMIETTYANLQELIDSGTSKNEI